MTDHSAIEILRLSFLNSLHILLTITRDGFLDQDHWKIAISSTYFDGIMLFGAGLLAWVSLIVYSGVVTLRTSSRVLLPKPKGQYQVSRVGFDLIDSTRSVLPPLSPNKVVRKLQVSLSFTQSQLLAQKPARRITSLG